MPPSPHKPRPTLLLVDDGATYADAIATHLPEFQLVRLPDGQLHAGDGPTALAYLREHGAKVDAILLDMHFDVAAERLLPLPQPGSQRHQRRFQGLAILHALRALVPKLPVVLLTGEADLALSEMGTRVAPRSLTYILDGEDLDALRIQIRRALADAALSSEESGILWGSDGQMAALRRRLQVLARGRMPVIIEGETGTGKSLLAERFVHVHSGRSGAFVVLDLSTVPSELVAAHLFGAVRGAYTGSTHDRKGVFEAAHGGTLFIDEIQNVPLEVQKQLLLVLQDGRLRRLGSNRDIQVDVKVIVASNTSLRDAVAAGQFRTDLYMRLSPATGVRIPALRERSADLAFFMKRFVTQSNEDRDVAHLRQDIAAAVGADPDAPLRLGSEDRSGSDRGLWLFLPQPAAQRLRAHPWPGNLRELAMVVHNLVTFTLVAAADALAAGSPLHSARLQVDAGLVDQLLGPAEPANGTAGDDLNEGQPSPPSEPLLRRDGLQLIQVRLKPAQTLNQVAQDTERQYLLALFDDCNGDFACMAEALLGDAARSRAVRLRFNQLGLKVRELRRGPGPEKD